MKKIVAMLLIAATLIVPFCGLADMGETVGELFALTDDWQYVNTAETTPKDTLFLVWIPTKKCAVLTYNQEIYICTGSRAELLMATCVATALADTDLTYGIDWLFAVNDEGYTKTEAQMFVLRMADKYLN